MTMYTSRYMKIYGAPKPVWASMGVNIYFLYNENEFILSYMKERSGDFKFDKFFLKK